MEELVWRRPTQIIVENLAAGSPYHTYCYEVENHSLSGSQREHWAGKVVDCD